MSLEIYLEIKSKIEQLPVLNDPMEYDPELDTIISILDEICDRLSETNKIDFIIEGFGEKWPVDVWCDLSILIEQLPEAFESLKEPEYSFIIDFYEQGAERKLIINGDSNTSIIKCKSERRDWTPEPDQIEIKKAKLFVMLKKVFENFLIVSNKVCPVLFKEKVFEKFVDDIKTNINKIDCEIGKKGTDHKR